MLPTFRASLAAGRSLRFCWRQRPGWRAGSWPLELSGPCRSSLGSVHPFLLSADAHGCPLEVLSWSRTWAQRRTGPPRPSLSPTAGGRLALPSLGAQEIAFGRWLAAAPPAGSPFLLAAWGHISVVTVAGGGGGVTFQPKARLTLRGPVHALCLRLCTHPIPKCPPCGKCAEQKRPECLGCACQSVQGLFEGGQNGCSVAPGLSSPSQRFSSSDF